MKGLTKSLVKELATSSVLVNYVMLAASRQRYSAK